MGHKVVALISGGKDSLYSILHCTQNGHDVVALANVFPGDGDATATTAAHDDSSGGGGRGGGMNGLDGIAQDLDSFMYQTVGHQVIPLYGEALRLPLHRRPISGTAVNKHKSYSFPHAIDDHHDAAAVTEDETESLYALLQDVKRAHPEVTAVSSGAILSDYQRTRVESVALRSNLVSLAYLWQFPELPPFSAVSLLEDMAAAGQDARIIKTASGGLDERHLWLNVATPRSVSVLQKATAWQEDDTHKGAVLGEGGEFETLCIDGPAPLWKKRIEVTRQGATMTGGGSWVASLQSARCVEKEPTPTAGAVRVPDVIEPMFQIILEHIRTSAATGTAPVPGPTGLLPSVSDHDTRLALTKPRSRLVSLRPRGEDDSTVQEQANDILSQLQGLLDEFHRAADDIYLTNVILRSMDDFAEINAVYGTIFTRPNPPARVTVACGDAMPRGCLVRMSFVLPGAAPSLEQRQGLHVQSQSYWAPANIGPYSQAVSASLDLPAAESAPSRTVYVAGQIPLAPASMTLHSEDFGEQAVLSLQHLWRIGRTMGVHWWTSAVAYIVAASSQEAMERSVTAQTVWRLAHAKEDGEEEEGDEDDAALGDEDESFDVGNRSLYRRHGASPTAAARNGPLPLPLWAKVAGGKSTAKIPPCFVVQVATLPRNASIEWTSQGMECGPGDKIFPSEAGFTLGQGSLMYTTTAYSKDSEIKALLETLKALPIRTRQALQVELWVERGLFGMFDVIEGNACTVVPVFSIWSGGVQHRALARWRQELR